MDVNTWKIFQPLSLLLFPALVPDQLFDQILLPDLLKKIILHETPAGRSAGGFSPFFDRVIEAGCCHSNV